jgi:hypothetical protein
VVETPILDAPLLATVTLWRAMITSRFVDSTRLTRSWLSIASASIPAVCQLELETSIWYSYILYYWIWNATMFTKSQWHNALLQIHVDQV